MAFNIKTLLIITLTTFFSFFVLLVPNSYSESADDELELLEQEANLKQEANKEYQEKPLEQEVGDITFTFDDGGRYVGEGNGTVPHGYGTSYYPSGNRYEGDWLAGFKHGQGTYTWANGDRYTGGWYLDEKSGQGTLTWAHGDRYEGRYFKDNKEGQGTYTWANGDRYTGEFQDGERHGQGTYYYSDASRYEGEWKYGKQTGSGTMTNPDGSPFRADNDGDGDIDFGDFLMFVGAALGVASAIVDMTSGSGSGGSRRTVNTNPSKGTAYTNPSQKGTSPSKKRASGGFCSGEMMTGGCSCWNRCCLWTWVVEDGERFEMACEVK